MKIRLLVAFSMFLLFGVALGVGFSVSGEYSITPRESSSVDIPSYTVTYNGTEYTSERLSAVDPGESLTVDTQGPTNTTYVVYLIDKQERVRRSDSASGVASSTFDTGRLDVGTYAVAVRNDTTRALHPVVVQGYDVTSSHRGSVATGTELEVTVALSATSNDVESPSRVTATVWNDSVTQETTATRVNETFYRARVPTKSLSTGTYSVLIIVEGSDQIAGQNEFVAVSNMSTVTVADQTTLTTTPTPTTTSILTPTTTDDGSDTGQTGSSGPTGGGDTPVTTPTATPVPATSQPTPEPTELSTIDGTSRTTSSTDQDPGATATPTLSTPSDQTLTSASESTAASGSGFGALQPLIAMLVLALLVCRRVD